MINYQILGSSLIIKALNLIEKNTFNLKNKTMLQQLMQKKSIKKKLKLNGMKHQKKFNSKNKWAKPLSRNMV